MAVWFTSDLHIGHRLVARLRRAQFVVDGFSDLTDEEVVLWHDTLVASGWDSAVEPDDIVWVLGDISVGGTSAQVGALNWIMERPGHKHLIAGNHDGCHPMHRDSHKWLPRYLDGPFESVQQSATRNIPLPDSGRQRVLVSHFPYEGEGDRSPDRFTQWRLRDEGLPVIHGHVHSEKKLTLSSHQHPAPWGLYSPAKQIHVGLDAWDLNLVSLEQISELLQ